MEAQSCRLPLARQYQTHKDCQSGSTCQNTGYAPIPPLLANSRDVNCNVRIRKLGDLTLRQLRSRLDLLCRRAKISGGAPQRQQCSQQQHNDEEDTHAPINDKSSATRPAGRHDGNHSAMAGFAMKG